MKHISLFILNLFAFSIILSFTVLGEAGQPSLVVSSCEATKGQTVTVTVSVINNPGIVSMYLNINYDTSRLKLTKVTDGGLLTDRSFGNNLNVSPYKVNWDGSLLENNITSNGVLVTFQFSVLESAALGTAVVSVSHGVNGILNYDLQRVPFTITNGGVSVIDAPVDFGDMKIHPNNYITNIQPNTDVNLLIGKITHASEISVTGSFNNSVATGTVLTLKNNNQTYTYTAVIYGDVVPDSVIDTYDLIAVKNHLLSKGKALAGAFYKAAAVSGNENLSIADLLMIKSHLLGSSINQNIA